MLTESRQRHSEAASAGGRGRVLLVTGMSGAGRSTALKTLEDMGYEAFDNLPLSLLPALIESAAADAPAIVVGADLRTRRFAIESMLETLDHAVGRTTRELGVIFIDCDDEQLERRYTETQQPHPLAGDRPVMDGIRLERRVVSALRDRAALVIDTSHLTAAALKRLRAGRFVQGDCWSSPFHHFFRVPSSATARCRFDLRHALSRQPALCSRDAAVDRA